jgi:hypothetical protein
MGAFWKLRERLLRSAGRIEGAIVAETLHNAWVNAFGQRRVTKTIVRQLLLVDDDDGNLLNGTPHYADITRAFVEQGFPDLFQDGPGISFSNHEGPTGVQPRLGPFQVEVDVRASFYPPVATVELAYREVRGDAVGEFLYLQPSSSDGEHFTFEIPALEPSVMRVDYFLSAEDSIGQILEFPATRRVWDQAVSPDQLEQPIGDEGDYHRFHLGHVTQAFECGLSPDCARDFDQIAFPWSFGVPLGRGGQTSSGVVWTDPARAFSGQTVFGQNYELLQVTPQHPPVDSLLRTAVRIDISSRNPGDRVLVHFKRWLTVDRSVHWVARFGLQLPLGSVTLWKNSEFATHVDREWADVLIDVTDSLGEAGCIPWLWWGLQDAHAEDAEILGGWNIDDVEVFLLHPLELSAAAEGSNASAVDLARGGAR